MFWFNFGIVFGRGYNIKWGRMRRGRWCTEVTVGTHATVGGGSAWSKEWRLRWRRLGRHWANNLNKGTDLMFDVWFAALMLAASWRCCSMLDFNTCLGNIPVPTLTDLSPLLRRAKVLLRYRSDQEDLAQPSNITTPLKHEIQNNNKMR